MGNLAKKLGVFLNRVLELLPKGRGAIKESRWRYWKRQGFAYRYWTVDSLNLYYDDLIGEKHVLYVPNSGHALEDRRRAINSISALTRSVITGSRLSEVKIELEDDDRILRFNSDDEPLYVDLWTASSEGMDFRGSDWASYPVPKEHDSYALPLVGSINT